MVAIHPLRSTDVAVIIIHGNTPPVTACIRSGTPAAFRILNGNVKTVNPYMTFPVITDILLRISRVNIHLFTLFGYITRD